MLARLLSKPSHLRLLSNLSSKSQPLHKLNPLLLNPFSTNNNNNNNNIKNPKPWNFSEEPDSKWDSLFSQDSSKLAAQGEESWLDENENNGGDILGGTEVRGKGEESWLDENENSDRDIFGRTEVRGTGEESCLDENENSDRDIFGGTEVGGKVEQEWFAAEEHKPWVLEEEEKKDELFDVGDIEVKDDGLSETEKAKKREKKKKKKLLREKKKGLSAVLEGTNRAFGDLIAASDLTDEMLASLIALRDFEDVDGLPPLRDIEDIIYEKNTRKSTRAEIERQKQEEVAKARVRQVDDKGRAYGTGRRKCSIARVWIQPGDGKFLVNDKQFDVYFPMLDHRAALLQPFSETKTLGLWDINCTVKGGGVSGQVGAIQLGISRALQNWEPDMRPSLKSVGLLTRDPRVVERKKPGKAKARKSFAWVKR